MARRASLYFLSQQWYNSEKMDVVTREMNIHQQCGMVHGGNLPLKTEKSNNPPSKNSGVGGRYPPPAGSEKLGPPWRAERAENFFLFFYVVKKFLTTFFFYKRDNPLPTKPEPYPYHPYPPPVEILDRWFEPPLYSARAC